MLLLSIIYDDQGLSLVLRLLLKIDHLLFQWVCVLQKSSHSFQSYLLSLPRLDQVSSFEYLGFSYVGLRSLRVFDCELQHFVIISQSKGQQFAKHH